MATWLITSFCLPVAMNAGMQIVLGARELLHHAVGAMIIMLALALMIMGSLTMVRLRRRRASGRRSTS